MTPRARLPGLFRLPPAAFRRRLWAGWLDRVARLGDAAAAALVAGVGLAGARPVLGAADLATGAADWHAHAYRLHALGQHGLAPWTHDWAGGLPLWSSYQFVPHAVTWAATLLTGAGETRAMAAIQGVLLVWLPLSVFLVLRLAGIRTLPALAGALLAAALDTRRQPAANFSELWGLALAPLLLWAAYRTTGRRAGYVTAVATGAAIYVHPLAAVTGCIGMLAAALVTRPGGAGRWLLALMAQAILALGMAAFFLWPLFDAARPAYEHPYFASAGFARLLARLAAGSFLPGWPLWFTLAAGGALALVFRGTGERRRGAGFLLLVAALIAVLALSSMAGWGPHAYRHAQLPRLLSVAPVLAAAALALAADELLTRRGGLRRSDGRRIGTLNASLLGIPRPAAVLVGAVPLLAALALSRGVGGTLTPAGSPATPASSFARWLRLQTELSPAGGRIAAGAEIVADASFFAYGQGWYTDSYSGREWSILAGPLAMYMDGFGAPETRSAYLTAMAVDLAVVPPGHRPALADPRTREPTAWEEVALLSDADVLRLPWRAPYAFAVPQGAEAGLEVPDLPFTTVAESYVRDELTRRYAGLALGPSANPARVRAPSGTTLDVELRELPPGQVLLVSENWDSAWRAEAGGRRLPVRRAGPNLIAVDLADAPRGVRGDVHVRLTHGLPRAWWLGGLTVLLTLAGAPLVLRWGPAGRSES